MKTTTVERVCNMYELKLTIKILKNKIPDVVIRWICESFIKDICKIEKKFDNDGIKYERIEYLNGQRHGYTTKYRRGTCSLITTSIVKYKYGVMLYPNNPFYYDDYR